MFKKKNAVTLYLVTTGLDNNIKNIENKPILMITAKKDEADEFIIRQLFNKYYSHFSLWCIKHNLQEADYQSWMKYMHIVLTKEDLESYSITRVTYTAEHIAAILREFSRCDVIEGDFSKTKLKIK